MSDMKAEAKNTGKELEKSLVPVSSKDGSGRSNLDDEFLGDLKMHAQEYGEKIQDAASRAKNYAEEKMTAAGDKLKELQNKDPREMLEDAKEYARQKPGQTILISAAIGLMVGLLIKGRR